VSARPKEKALLFGRARSLVAVLSEPPRDADTRGKPGIIFLNSGVLHRVGPNRMYIALARALAADGFAALRFDFSGIGDSEPRRDAVTGDASTMEEARDAMEALTAARGVRRFILIGLCSGADNAFQIARVDDRVVGAVMIDGYAYRTFGFHLRFWAERLGSAARWRRAVTRVLAGRRNGTSPSEAMYVRAFPPKRRVLEDCRALMERGTELCFIYSAGQYQYYNYRRQFDDAFPALRRERQVTVTYFPDANHTFTRLSHQRRLVEAIRAWTPRTIDSAAARGPGPGPAPQIAPSTLASAQRA
jgi:dienelactone hydrolase